jgi:alpha-glucosidase
MTWLGAPTVYYGDEAGLQGGADPDDRRFFPWANQNSDLESYYRKVINIRDSTPALQDGAITRLTTSDSNRIVSFMRADAHDMAVVAVNDDGASHTVRLTLPKSAGSPTLVDKISGTSYTVANRQITITLPAKTSAILVGSPNAIP